MEYAIQTFGCKVNQYESAVISEGMIKNGFTKADNPKLAEIVIINSCSVTEQSDKKACQLIRKLKNNNQDCIIALCGCFPQAFKADAEKSGADIIIGTENKDKLPDIIYNYVQSSQKDVYSDISELTDRLCFNDMPLSDMGKTRAFIKIEDGCDRYCAYCIIPYARGKVRSRTLDNIIKETEYQVSCGHKEMVLVGINLSLYGSDIGLRLADAVHAVCKVPGVERVRLSSLEPELITEEDIKRLSEEPKLCPHFHLALQSGCEATLKRMNRHYTPDEYYSIVENLRRYFPDCSITTDVMVGFAGETDNEFEESLAFCKKVGFAAMHVFTYSVRSGTAAAERKDFVAPETAATRYKRMSELAAEMKTEYFKGMIGKTRQVLIQKRKSESYANGLTPEYVPVRIYNCDAKKHDILTIKVTSAQKNEFCVGETEKAL